MISFISYFYLSPTIRLLVIWMNSRLAIDSEESCSKSSPKKSSNLPRSRRSLLALVKFTSICSMLEETKRLTYIFFNDFSSLILINRMLLLLDLNNLLLSLMTELDNSLLSILMLNSSGVKKNISIWVLGASFNPDSMSYDISLINFY